MTLTSPGTKRQSSQQVQYEDFNCRDTFGDKFKRKKSNHNIRIVFQNINGIGTTEDTCKRKLIKDFISKYKIDVFGMSEVNTNWKLVGKKETLQALASSSFENSRVNGKQTPKLSKIGLPSHSTDLVIKFFFA